MAAIIKRIPALTKQCGVWATARYCAKRDVPFEVAHEAILGVKPRF